MAGSGHAMQEPKGLPKVPVDETQGKQDLLEGEPGGLQQSGISHQLQKQSY